MAPASRIFWIVDGVPSGTRTRGTTPSAAAELISRYAIVRSSGACSRSITTKSNPQYAMISDGSVEAIFSQVPSGVPVRSGANSPAPVRRVPVTASGSRRR